MSPTFITSTTSKSSSLSVLVSGFLELLCIFSLKFVAFVWFGDCFTSSFGDGRGGSGGLEGGRGGGGGGDSGGGGGAEGGGGRGGGASSGSGGCDGNSAISGN